SVALDLGAKAQRLEARYGFHDFHDPALGMDPQAYIKFMQLEASLETDSWLLTRAQVADILSLQDFVWHLPQRSWRAGLNYAKVDDESQWRLSGGLGLARTVEDSWQGFALVVAQAQRENETRKSFLLAGLNLG